MSSPSCLRPSPQCFDSVPAPASSLPKLLFINTDQNILLPAETHMEMALLSHTLPSALSHMLFATVKLRSVTHSPGSCQHSCPRCLESGPPSPTTPVFSMGFSKRTCVLTAEDPMWGPGQHVLCPQTWAVSLISCYCVTLGNGLNPFGHQMPHL